MTKRIPDASNRTSNIAQTTLPSFGDITFAAGYILRYIEDYARSRELPTITLAIGVADIIRAATFGEVLGPEDYVPTVRQPSPQRSKALGEMAVDDHTRTKVQKITNKAKRSKGTMWEQMTGKPHWTQTPAGRKKNQKALRAMQRAYREKNPRGLKKAA